MVNSEGVLGMSAQENVKEEQILKAAMEVFVEKGRDGARMQEIADRAGINKALLHYYFRSKDNIYEKILRKVFFGFFKQLESLVKTSASLADLLQGIINGFIDMFTANPNLHLFIIHELSQGGREVKKLLEGLVLEGEFDLPRWFVKRVSEEYAAGQIVKVDPPQLILCIIGSCVYYFLTEPLFMAIFSPGASFDRERFISERKKAVFDIMYYGIKPRGKNDAE